MTEKVRLIIEKGDYKIPFILFQNYKNMGLDEKEFIFLIYLLNEDSILNPKKASAELNEDQTTILTLLDSLTSKGFIEIKLKERTKEEYVSFAELYKKLAYFVTSEEIVSETKKTNIYDLFETEFSRTLSPIEYELITGWLNANFSEEIISLALKEAVYNGASNLRYVDKVLYEWKKKGITTKEKYEQEKEKFQNNKKEVKPKKELIDYDWLNEDR